MDGLGAEKFIVAAFNIVIATQREEKPNQLDEDRIIEVLLAMCRSQRERMGLWPEGDLEALAGPFSSIE